MGNLIGEPFDKYVNQQIELRQSVYGSGFGDLKRSPEYITYLNSRVAWVKLASSVIINPDITPEELEKQNNSKWRKFNVRTGNSGVDRLVNLGFSNNEAQQYVGNALARQAVLFNGMQGLEAENVTATPEGQEPYRDPTVSGKFLSYKRRRGYSKSNSIFTSFQKDPAYGLGGTEFGLQPMPGIMDWKVDYKNRGSLRSGTITIRAFNRFQFELIDLLYLRLGFTMMLEWGNSHYLPNNSKNGIIKEVGNTLIENDWFAFQTKEQREKNNQVGLLEKIENYRKLYDGNYDGFFGRVTNFDWKFNSDGSYDINIKLMSLGDIIESMRMNIGGTSKGGAADDADSGNAIDLKLNELKADPDVFNATDNAPYITMVPTDTDTLVSQTEDMAERVNKYGYFWRFGDFLKYVQDDLIPASVGSGEAFKKLEIDFDTDTNIMPCYPNQFSIDPRICVVRNTSGQSLQFDDRYTSKWYKSMSQWNTSDGGGLHAKLCNIYINFDFISTILEQNSNNEGDIDFYTFFDSLCQGLNRALGGINKLGCHLRDSVIITFQDENTIGGNGELVRFLNPDIDADSAQIQVFGYNTEGSGSSNFVKDVTFETKIDSALSNMMSISATANGGGVPTAFSQWNDGLTDKFYQSELPPIRSYKATPAQATTTGSQGQIELSEAAISKINAANNNLIKDKFDYYVTECFGTPMTAKTIKKVLLTKENAEILLGITEGTVEVANQAVMSPRYEEFDSSFINKGISIAKDKLDRYASGHWEETGTSIGSVGFIPLNLGLTVDGISGIKIYQKLNVDTSFLPNIYTDELSFTIMKVGHTIQNGEWLTQLDAISQPIIQPLTDPPVESVEYDGEFGFEEVELSIDPPIGASFYPPVKPTNGKLTVRNDSGGFGYFGAPRVDRLHLGVDITASIDTSIYAPITGKILFYDPMSGKKLSGFQITGVDSEEEEIDYTGYLVKVLYNDKLSSIKNGDTVTKGDKIAEQANLHKPTGDYDSDVGQHTHFAVEWDSGAGKVDLDPTSLEYDIPVEWISVSGGLGQVPERTDKEIWQYYKGVWGEYSGFVRRQEIYSRFNSSGRTFETDLKSQRLFGQTFVGGKVVVLNRTDYYEEFGDSKRKSSRDFYSFVTFQDSIRTGELIFDSFEFDNSGFISNPKTPIFIRDDSKRNNLIQTRQINKDYTEMFNVDFAIEFLETSRTNKGTINSTAETKRTVKTVMDSLRKSYEGSYKDPKSWIARVLPKNGEEPYDGFYIRMNNTQFTGDSVLEDKIEEEYLKKFDKNF